MVLCGANSYTQKYYLGEQFAMLPEQIKDELQIMCVLYVEDIGGVLTLEYDSGIPEGCVQRIQELFSREEVIVEKRAKNGPKPENIIPMIRRLETVTMDENVFEIRIRVCCQNPSLNPMQLSAAIDKYLPEVKPDFVRCCRVEVYDEQETVFR